MFRPSGVARLLQHPARIRTSRNLHITSAPAKRSVTASATTSTSPASRETSREPEPAQADTTYYGPLTATFRRLKIFSLSSLTLSFALTPFIFVIETTSSVPLIGRFALAAVALTTSSVSTGLVAWCGRPYVTKLRWLEPEGVQSAGSGKAVEMTTLTLALHERITRVYDTAFLVPTNSRVGEKSGSPPREETIAETSTKDGGVVGRWIVDWDEHGTGTCREVGQIARYFNVHQELLDRPIR
ncbi:hypothetical protein A0H81_10416 [Grifola frondosa]|uniref:Uncharacterized protein n=1 Tax=Grifola frondosa TaxID=5627 RepID=A0A1C7LXP2_GRIFR|nr:hypothetical protein A0H81_10416 [Grifola frondosa]